MSGGGKSGGGSSTTTQQNYSPEEAARRAQVMGEAERIYNHTAPSMSSASYPGEQPVPFSTPSIAAQNLAVHQAGQQQIGSHLANQAMEYGLTGAMDVQNNPYLQSAITAALRPMTQQYVDPGGVLSSIRTNATDSGQFGGVRQGVAEGIAAGRYTQNASDMAGKMASAAYDKGQDTFSRTLALAPQTMSLNNMPVSTLSGVGAQQEVVAQEEAAYLANQNMWNLNAPWAPLQNYANIVYGGASPSTTSTSSGEAVKKNRATGALGGAASGAMMGSYFGPWGTAIGGAAGALLGGLG